ncbi:hypothetical protein LINGRAPRIM_LOCUS2444 [Linum grandiflorum]
MTIILQYVTSYGVLTARFFDINSVAETSSKTFKKIICDVLSQYNLQVLKLRGQGYDGELATCQKNLIHYKHYS